MTKTDETTAAPARGRYHHGDLRETLIAASLALIEKTRVEKFSVADAARAAGVSSGAPYRHFADREDLLDHVAAKGFMLLKERSDAAWAAHPAGALEGLIASGRAYIAFGAEHPELFHLMWGATRPHAADGAAQETGAACYAGFIEKLTLVMAAEGLGHLEPRAFATPLWAMVQGYASLLIGQNRELDARPEAIAAQVDRAARAYFAGMRQVVGA